MLIRINEIETRRAKLGAKANSRPGSQGRRPGSQGRSRAAAATIVINRAVISKAGVINRPTIKTANPERAESAKRI
jgi:hypothetical protein